MNLKDNNNNFSTRITRLKKKLIKIALVIIFFIGKLLWKRIRQAVVIFHIKLYIYINGTVFFYKIEYKEKEKCCWWKIEWKKYKYFWFISYLFWMEDGNIEWNEKKERERERWLNFKIFKRKSNKKELSKWKNHVFILLLLYFLLLLLFHIRASS